MITQESIFPVMPLFSTSTLLHNQLFKIRQETLPRDTRIKLSHQRAAAIAQHFGLNAQDVRDMTPRFWAAHADPIPFRDTGAMTNMTIQHNVVIGTLLDQGKGRGDLGNLIEDLLAYRIS